MCALVGVVLVCCPKASRSIPFRDRGLENRVPSIRSARIHEVLKDRLCLLAALTVAMAYESRPSTDQGMLLVSLVSTFVAHFANRVCTSLARWR